MTAEIINDLGGVAQKQGDFEKARTCFEQVVALREENLDQDMC